MKTRLRKCLFSIMIISVLLVAVLILYSVTVYVKDYPEYSSYSAGKTGVKALYLLAGKCGFQVSRYHYPVKFLREKPVMVAYRPAESLFNETEEQDGLKEWLKQGNTLVLILDERNIGDLWIFDFISENRQWYEVVNTGKITATWYGLGNGLVCVLDSADSFLNSNIAASDAAVAFINVLTRINNPKVIFNEYYQYMQVPSPRLWDLIGHIGQLTAIQLLTAVILVVIRGWKPFGRVRGDKRLTMRSENEIVKALSGLYQRMNAYPLVLSNYYGFFTQKYGRFLTMPGALRDKAVRLLAECEFYLRKGSISKKELKRLVLGLEKLEYEINNRGQTTRKE